MFVKVEIKGCVPYVFGGKGNEKVELGDYWNLPITRKLGKYVSIPSYYTSSPVESNKIERERGRYVNKVKF